MVFPSLDRTRRDPSVDPSYVGASYVVASYVVASCVVASYAVERSLVDPP